MGRNGSVARKTSNAGRGPQAPKRTKEFALLRTLASEPHRVFTKQELLRDVWCFRSDVIERHHGIAVGDAIGG